MTQEPTQEAPVVPRASVGHFARLMERKLREHDEDRGTDGWRGLECDVKYLLDRVIEEVEELRSAFNDADRTRLVKESVDVANFCMMITDRIDRPLQ